MLGSFMFSLTSSQKLFGEKAFLALTWNGGRGTVSEMREAAARLRGGSSGIKASADFRNSNSLTENGFKGFMLQLNARNLHQELNKIIMEINLDPKLRIS